MQDSIIHILEILAALAIWSVFMFFIYVRRSKLGRKAGKKEIQYIIEIKTILPDTNKTELYQYWKGIQYIIADPHDLRYWTKNKEKARTWYTEEGIKKYISRNNVPGNVIKCPTS